MKLTSKKLIRLENQLTELKKELEKESQYDDFDSIDLDLYASDIKDMKELIEIEKSCINKALTENNFIKLALDTTIKKATVHMSASKKSISQLLEMKPISSVNILVDDISIERFTINDSLICDYAYILPNYLDSNSTLDYASQVLVLRYKDESETLYKIYR